MMDNNFPYGQWKPPEKLIEEINKMSDKNCEHPLNEIILERNYYGPDEDVHYTNYFKCDKCGEEIETEDSGEEFDETELEKENLKDEERWNSD